MKKQTKQTHKQTKQTHKQTAEVDIYARTQRYSLTPMLLVPYSNEAGGELGHKLNTACIHPNPLSSLVRGANFQD